MRQKNVIITFFCVSIIEYKYLLKLMTISCFINALIDNINTNDIPKDIDLILDGGAFNGIYILGGLMYIKELERREKINIKRISGCSIGAVIGIFYILE